MSTGSTVFGMTPEDFESQRKELGERLRALRLQTEWSGRALGDRAGMSQSKVSKLECGRVTPSESDVRAIASVLRLSGDVTERLVADVSALSLEVIDAETPANRQQRYRKLEANARCVDSFLPLVTPALLQTPAYAAALFKSTPWLVQRDIDELLKGRIERHASLYDSTRTFRFLLTSTSLTARFGSTAIWRAQMIHLLEIYRRPNIDIRVLTRDVIWPLYPLGEFVIFDGGTVAVELPAIDLFLRSTFDVTTYTNIFDGLWNVARRSGDFESIVMAELALASEEVDLRAPTTP